MMLNFKLKFQDDDNFKYQNTEGKKKMGLLASFFLKKKSTVKKKKEKQELIGDEQLLLKSLKSGSKPPKKLKKTNFPSIFCLFSPNFDSFLMIFLDKKLLKYRKKMTEDIDLINNEEELKKRPFLRTLLVRFLTSI